MHLSPATKINLQRIIPFGVIWFVFSLVYSLLERGLLGTLQYYPSTGTPYVFGKAVFVTAFTALVLGLLIGSIEILYINKLFQKTSFAKKIILKTLIYLVIIIAFLLIITLAFDVSVLKMSIFKRRVWETIWLFFSNFAFWSVEIYIAAIIGVTLFYTEVSENLGYAVLSNFLTGRYHRPVEEERIFMFLDMKSSTTLAENMGHVRYFEMLKTYFSDLTDPIIENAGEIYQYVGDEIVVSWKLRNGLERNNCIQCFYAIKSGMNAKAGNYIERFGASPEFKAGLHVGKVIAGEIGVVKKEIIFTGDVLNTTARIQGLCNFYQVDLLISGKLIKKLDLHERYAIRSFGKNELRGRDEKIELFTISPI